MSKSDSVAKLKELLPELFQPVQLSGLPYLRFQLTPQLTGLISMEYVQESLLVPAENITPLPNMSPWVVGLMSSREQVFCVVDLFQLLGISSLSWRQQYSLILLRVSELMSQPNYDSELLLGIAVDGIQGITRVVQEDCCSLQKDVLPNLNSYLSGWIIDKEQTLFILNLKAIVNKALQRSL